MRIKNPKNRLKKILDACKNKPKCEAAEDVAAPQGQESEGPAKKSHGGCGALQPKLCIDGLQIIAEYKPSRKKCDEQEQLPEPVERKLTLNAERVRRCLLVLFDTKTFVVSVSHQQVGIR